MWLFIALGAHILFGIVFVLDRFLVSKVAPHPLVYTFWVSILQGVVILLIPFAFLAPLFGEVSVVGSALYALFPEGFGIPEARELWVSFFAAVASLVAFFLFFSALKIGEASRIVPIVGSANPMFALLFGFLFLSERLAAQEIVAFGILVAGGILISIKRFALHGFAF